MTKKDIVALCALFVFGLITRTLFLGAIPQVVFDEVHFGKFISSYCCTHERFFDIHPPVGKLIIAGGAYLSGYDGSFSFENIGQAYGSTPIANIRLAPALAGALLPLIIFILLRQLSVSPELSFLGGAVIAFDNALVVESRFILTDSILFAGTFGALMFALAAVQAHKNTLSWVWVVLAGVSSGVAVGTKFTGMVGGGLVAVLFLYRAYMSGVKHYASWAMKIIVAAAVAALVYVLGWWIHFALLTVPGSGDVWGIPTGNFIQDLIKTHQQMVSANYNLTADHPYGSKWWTWPFMKRSVFYWQGADSQFIYLLGNPIVWWGSFAVLCASICTYFFSFVNRKKQWGVVSSPSYIWLMVLGYFWAYVPLMRVPRVLFLYHYITPLIFSSIVAVWWIDKRVRHKKEFMIMSVLVVVAGFLIISPLTYGFFMSEYWQSALFATSASESSKSLFIVPLWR